VLRHFLMSMFPPIVNFTLMDLQLLYSTLISAWLRGSGIQTSDLSKQVKLTLALLFLTLSAKSDPVTFLEIEQPLFE